MAIIKKTFSLQNVCLICIFGILAIVAGIFFLNYMDEISKLSSAFKTLAEVTNNVDGMDKAIASISTAIVISIAVAIWGLKDSSGTNKTRNKRKKLVVQKGKAFKKAKSKKTLQKRSARDQEYDRAINVLRRNLENANKDFDEDGKDYLSEMTSKVIREMLPHFVFDTTIKNPFLWIDMHFMHIAEEVWGDEAMLIEVPSFMKSKAINHTESVAERQKSKQRIEEEKKRRAKKAMQEKFQEAAE